MAASTKTNSFFIFSCLLIINLLITSSCSAIQIISNNATKKTEFVLFNRRSLVIPNYHRSLARSSLKFSLLSGSSQSTIINRVEEKSPISWKLILENSNARKPASVYFEKKEHPKNPFLTEYTFNWIGGDSDDQREVCFHYAHNNASWYNTYQSLSARWPMDTTRTTTSRRPFNYLLDFDYDEATDEALLVLEHLFINSDGFALFLDSTAPLFIRRDANYGDPLLCISLNNSYPYSTTASSDLTFRLFAGRSAKAIYEIVANQFGLIPKPTSVPAERLFRSPTFTTWNVFTEDSSQENTFNQANVLKYAENLVVKYGFPNDSTLELHRRWERTYGDFVFDETRFPDPKTMVKKLQATGHQVTLWTYPNIHTDSTSYAGAEKYFVQEVSNYSASSFFGIFKSTGSSPLIINYSDGAGSYVDFSNPQAGEWFVKRLQRLVETTGVDGFHFNEAVLYDFRGPLGVCDPAVARTPSLLTKMYADIAYQLTESKSSKKLTNIVVDSAFKNQYLGNFVDLAAKAGDWSYANGLRSLIPSVLSLSLAGYSFIVPGIIGGGYGGGGGAEAPSSELYIRWVQASALMTSMKFGLPPWTYSEPEILTITQKFVALHRQYSSLLVELAGKRHRDGTPILRPLWWAAPDDPKAYTVDDQFMVGDDLMVAPVLVEGARKRIVRLPPGNWTDQKGRGPFQGSADLEVEAPLEELPYFKRISR